jgi:hypothetical protein
MKFVKTIIVLAIALCFITPAIAQTGAADKPADNMQILRDKIKADKKFMIAANMQLTEAEAKGFWPIYEAYQKELDKLHKRGQDMIDFYGEAFVSKSMDNAKAKKMTADFIAIRADELKQVKAVTQKLGKALPATKVARYLQLENKIRAIVNYDAAAKIPLVPDK